MTRARRRACVWLEQSSTAMALGAARRKAVMSRTAAALQQARLSTAAALVGSNHSASGQCIGEMIVDV